MPLDVLKRQWTGSKSNSKDVVTFLTDTYDRLEKASRAATHQEDCDDDQGAKSQLFEVGDLWGIWC